MIKNLVDFEIIKDLGYINKEHQKRYLVRCKSCGAEKQIYKSSINKKMNCNCKKKSGNRIYNIYNGMKQRCYNQNIKNYKIYGGKGVIICEDWLNDYYEFYKWSMANGYKKNLSIDRIDNNGNYEPNNCRWVDAKTQCNNKSNNLIFEYKGIKKTLKEWCDYFNFNYDNVQPKIKRRNNTFESVFNLESENS